MEEGHASEFFSFRNEVEVQTDAAVAEEVNALIIDGEKNIDSLMQ